MARQSLDGDQNPLNPKLEKLSNGQRGLEGGGYAGQNSRRVVAPEEEKEEDLTLPIKK